QRLEGGAALAGPAVELTEHHAHEAAGLTDHARLGDRGADLGNAAHHRVLTNNWDQPLVRINAVLERDDRGGGPDDWPDRCTGTLHVPQLDAEQHEIDRPNAGR